MAAQRSQQTAQTAQTAHAAQGAPAALRRFQTWFTDHLSIRQRVALWIALLVTATLLLFSVIVFTVEQNQLQSNATSDIRVRAVSIADALRQGQSVTQGTGGSNVLPTPTATGRAQGTTSATTTSTTSTTSTTTVTPASPASVTPGASASPAAAGSATPQANATGSPGASATVAPTPTPASTPDPTTSRLIQSRLELSKLNVLGQLDLGFEVLDTSGRLKYLAPSLNQVTLPTNLDVIDAAIHGTPGYYMKRNSANALLEIYAQPIIVSSEAQIGQVNTAASPTPTARGGAKATPTSTGDTRGVDIGGGQEVIGVVLVAKPFDDIVNTLNTLNRILLIGDIILILLVSLGGWWIAENGLRPIATVTRAARAIAINAHAAGLGTRVTYHGPRDEVGELVSTFNDMLASIEQVTNAQRRFVADASHELRAPLTTIKGSLEFLRRAPDLPEEDRMALLEDAYAESERMAALVSDLLLLARVDASASSRGARAALLDEQLTWRREPVEVDQLAMEVFRYGRAQLRARHKDLSLIISNLEPVTVLADPGQLRQLALILLDNAIKYTPAGGKIRLSVTRNGARAAFSVADTGIGIDPADRPHIFERFYRADRARERDEHGSGLGLAIARWIAEAHGGEMSVHSQPGQGSTFTALLPAVRKTGEQGDTSKSNAIGAGRAAKKPTKKPEQRPEKPSGATPAAAVGMNPLAPLARLAKSVSRPRSSATTGVGGGASAPVAANATSATNNATDSATDNVTNAPGGAVGPTRGAGATAAPPTSGGVDARSRSDTSNTDDTPGARAATTERQRRPMPKTPPKTATPPESGSEA